MVLADGGALVWFPVQHLLDVAVAQQFPAAIQAGLDHLGIFLAHRGVEADGARQVEVVEDALHAPESHPHPVVVPRVVGNVGRHGGALGRGQDGSGHGLPDVPFLHVDNEPHGDLCPVGQGQPGPVENGRVFSAWVGHGVGLREYDRCRGEACLAPTRGGVSARVREPGHPTAPSLRLPVR